MSWQSVKEEVLMYAVTHFTVGLMLGQAAGNPYAAFALGLASHVILDAIPHSDYSKTIHGIADFVAVMAACYVSVRLGAGASGLVGGFSGVLPDLEVAIAHLRSGGDLSAQKCRFFFPSHTGLVRHGRLRPPWGIVTQIAAVGAVWAVLSGSLI
ncbi:MAG: hypothetical protein WAP39_06195 [Bacillota bacterium]|jgi:hypothetical protein